MPSLSLTVVSLGVKTEGCLDSVSVCDSVFRVWVFASVFVCVLC